MINADEKTVTDETSEKRTGPGATSKTDDKKLPENSKENLDKRLDQAAEESFPGSDPVSVKITR